MVGQLAPTEDELYLYALLMDPTGRDLAEFAWVDETRDDKCFRLWDFQWPWYGDPEPYQIDQASRTLGKSEGIAMRACAHPFTYPGQERLITAPELNHLRPVVDNIEKRIKGIWFLRELCPNDRHMGISRQPAWQIRFKNGSEIRSRLPNKDGKGVKGQHPAVIELDEAQDYPEPGWTEIIECLKEVPGAQWRAHGVPKGIRDRFWKFTTGADPALPWRVHRVIAMQRPTWNDLERRRKTAMYGGSRTNPDYRRNMYGEHGDASSPLFVLARLMACVDQDPESTYNTEVYSNFTIVDEDLTTLREGWDLDDPGLPGVDSILETAVPGIHKVGYTAYYGGMDLGLTNHPSELLIFGQMEKGGRMRLLLRIHMERVRLEDQEAVVRWLQAFYGKDKFHFGLDRAGLGQRSAQTLADGRIEDGLVVPYGKQSRIQGWDFMEKLVVELDTEADGEIEDQYVWRYMIDYSSEELRTWVDAKKLELPNDHDLPNQWQGQTTSNPKGSDIDPNRPKRSYSKGTFHALDAGKYMIASRTLPNQHALIEQARKARKKSLPRTFIPGAQMM